MPCCFYRHIPDCKTGLHLSCVRATTLLLNRRSQQTTAMCIVHSYSQQPISISHECAYFCTRSEHGMHKMLIWLIEEFAAYLLAEVIECRAEMTLAPTRMAKSTRLPAPESNLVKYACHSSWATMLMPSNPLSGSVSSVTSCTASQKSYNQKIAQHVQLHTFKARADCFQS